MADATFEFSSDDDIRKLNEQVEKGNNELKNTKKKLSEAEQLFAEVEAARVRIARKRMQTRAEQIASGRQNWVDVSGSDPGTRAIAPYQNRVINSPGNYADFTPNDPELKPAELSEKGKPGWTKSLSTGSKKIDEFVTGLAAAGPAITGFVAAVKTAGDVVNGAAQVKSSGLNEIGDKKVVIARAAQELHLDQNDLFASVARQPDQQGALRYLAAMTARAQGGIGTMPGQVALAMRAGRLGIADWSAITQYGMQGRYVQWAGRKGFANDSFESKYLNVIRSRNAASMYESSQAVQDDDFFKSATNAEFNDAAWHQFELSNPAASQIPGARWSRSFRTASEARRLRSLYMNPDNLAGNDYFGQVPAQPGNAPVIRQGPDMTNNGRDVAAVAAAAAAQALRATRKPDPRSGTRPGE